MLSNFINALYKRICFNRTVGVLFYYYQYCQEYNVRNIFDYF